MKTLKISLVVIVVAAIAAGVYMWLAGINPPPLPPPVDNQFTRRINQEIDSLGKLPDSKFCKEFYKEIEYLINDYYKPAPPTYPYGRFGKNQSENDQWKEALSKNLYSAYADKFIKQAFYIFRGSAWNIDDLKFIRSEYPALRKSKWLERGSPVDNKFAEIQNIFSKYDEIVGFISACKSFQCPGIAFSDRFPISEVESNISRATRYRNNRLDNEYVNNCTRLHDGLREIPQTLFKVHVKYLNNKVDKWSDKFSNYNSFDDYQNYLYIPLKSEIEALDNEIYNVSDSESRELLLKNWRTDQKKADDHKYPKR